MDIVRGWEDVLEVAGNSHVVIWGMGRLGHMLLQEVNANGLNDIWVFDQNGPVTNNAGEYITREWIKDNAACTVFIIAVKSEDAVNEISNEILSYNDKAMIYRYMARDRAFLTQRLDEIGFYNGAKRIKALDRLSARKMLEEKINDGQPFLCSRWGSVEGETVYGDLAGLLSDPVIFSLKNNAGFYPIDKESIHKFVVRSINAAKEVDILIAGCWCREIEDLYRFYSPEAVLVTSDVMYPFWADSSWTGALKGKRVLVVHPFAELIEKQYGYRDKLFKTQDILPNMDLIVYQAVQSMNGNPKFDSWFEALEKMEDDISKIDFDIALIGCGAYGMPLGAYIKSELHKMAIHMGGSLQILFGIKGKRWEGNSYDYQHKLYNEYWVRPTDDLKPKNYKDVENGCYW